MERPDDHPLSVVVYHFDKLIPNGNYSGRGEERRGSTTHEQQRLKRTGDWPRARRAKERDEAHSIRYKDRKATNVQRDIGGDYPPLSLSSLISDQIVKHISAYGGSKRRTNSKRDHKRSIRSEGKATS